MFGLPPMLGVALSGLVFVYLVARFWNEHRITGELQTSGITVQAHVVKADIKKGGWFRRDREYSIRYRFDTGDDTHTGQTYWRWQEVSELHFTQIRRTVTVSYLEADPRVSRLSGLDRDTTDLNGLWLGILATLMATIWGIVAEVWF